MGELPNMLDKVVDSVSGFGGIITAVCEYAYGSPQYQVTYAPEWADGLQSEVKTEWFEGARLKVVQRAEA